MLEFAKLGSYCEWDLFGIETSHYMLDSGFDMPSDAQRLRTIRWLIDEGYEDRVVIAHDLHTNHRLVTSSSSHSDHTRSAHTIYKQAIVMRGWHVRRQLMYIGYMARMMAFESVTV